MPGCRQKIIIRKERKLNIFAVTLLFYYFRVHGSQNSIEKINSWWYVGDENLIVIISHIKIIQICNVK